jgi:hypothetical protein
MRSLQVSIINLRGDKFSWMFVICNAFISLHAVGAKDHDIANSLFDNLHGGYNQNVSKRILQGITIQDHNEAIKNKEMSHNGQTYDIIDSLASSPTKVVGLNLLPASKTIVHVPDPWKTIAMPKRSYFGGFPAPSDPLKWNQAQLQASRGNELMKSFKICVNLLLKKRMTLVLPSKRDASIKGKLYCEYY